MRAMILMLTTLFAAAPAFGGGRQPGANWMRFATPGQAGWSAEKLRLAESYAESIGSRGFLLIADGAIVSSWGDFETRYPCASIRKPFLGALYGIHVTEGRIDPRASLADLGIDDIDPALTAAEKQATIIDLLTARSGVYHTAAFESESSMRARPERGSHTHGTFWYYNNWDFNVLATIFESRTGTRIFEEFDRRIAKPIGMEDFRVGHGYYLFERDRSNHPAYLFRMNALDMARFGQLYLDRGRWHGRQIVPESWVVESTREHTRASDDDGFGYLWWLLGDDFREHGAFAAEGAGTQLIVVLPKLNAVFVHVTNTFDRETVPRHKALELLRRVIAAKQGAPVRHAAVRPLKRRAPQAFARFRADVLQRYAGIHTMPGGVKVPVEIRSGELSVETRIGKFPLHPVSEREFIVEDMGTRVFFELAEDGKSIEFIVEPLWIRGAQALVKRGQTRDAVDALVRLVARYPVSTAVHEALGDALSADGRRDEAAARYRAALAIEPNRSSVMEKLRQLEAATPK